MRTASQAVAYSRRFTQWRTQYCLNFVQSMLNAAWMGPYAEYAWQHARHKRTDRNPPAGVPVYILGSHYGHVALSVGGGRIRSTDWPSRGRVGETSIANLERAWGRRYVGWTADAAPGQLIPGVSSSRTPAPATPVAATSKPEPEGVPDMRMVEAPDRGVAVYGAGYWKSLTPEERDVLLSHGVPLSKTNARGFDVTRAAATHGAGARRTA